MTVLHLHTPVAGGGCPHLRASLDANLPVLRLRCDWRVPTTAANLWAVMAALRRLGRAGRRPQLLHAHEPAAGLAAVLAGRALGIPVVVSEHSSGFALDQYGGAAAHVARLVFEGADLVCPVSESLLSSLQSGGWGGRYRVVPNIVDTEQFTPAPSLPDEPPVILTVASLEPVKGVEELVEAVALLRARRREFRVVLAGEGRLAGTLAARADTLGLGDSLALLGPVPHAQLPKLMRRAAFLVVPSRWETFSVALSEGMACGLPVVATAVGALPERVDPETGLLCRPGDPAALAQAIDTMLDRWRDYDRGAIASKVRAHFSATAVADQWEEVYAEVLVLRRRHVSRGRPVGTSTR